MDILCVLHDSDDAYGLVRWPLAELVMAAGASPAHARELVAKGVLKGSDTELTEPYIYVPRSGRKDGAPVTLIPAQKGPIWFSSRQVRDEYIRTIRGEGTRFGDAPKLSPTRRIGDGPSSSTSSSASPVDTELRSVSPAPGKPVARKPRKALEEPDGFAEFYIAYPKHVARRAAVKAYRAAVKRAAPVTILAGALAYGRQCAGKEVEFIAHPATWLNADRWADDAPQLAVVNGGGPDPKLAAMQAAQEERNRAYERELEEARKNGTH